MVEMKNEIGEMVMGNWIGIGKVVLVRNPEARAESSEIKRAHLPVP